MHLVEAAAVRVVRKRLVSGVVLAISGSGGSVGGLGLMASSGGSVGVLGSMASSKYLDLENLLIRSGLT